MFDQWFSDTSPFYSVRIHLKKGVTFVPGNHNSIVFTDDVVFNLHTHQRHTDRDTICEIYVIN